MATQHRSTIGPTKAAIEDDTNPPEKEFQGKSARIVCFLITSNRLLQFALPNSTCRGQLGGSAFARNSQAGQGRFFAFNSGKPDWWLPSANNFFCFLVPDRKFRCQLWDRLSCRIRQLNQPYKLRIFADGVKVLVFSQFL